jgi:predicted amino acid racemase
MLVELLLPLGIQVVGVTKAVLGSPEIARAMLAAGAVGLGDSRIENIETMRRAGVRDTLSLIRSPMITQIDRVVASADISFNTELDVIRKLSTAARLRGRVHRVVLMVELGDLREGIMPDDLESVVRETLRLPNIMLEGIGANLACRSGVAPSAPSGSRSASFLEAIPPVSRGRSAARIQVESISCASESRYCSVASLFNANLSQGCTRMSLHWSPR